MSDENYEVRNAEVEGKLRDIGNKIASSIKGTGMGFCLTLFDFGEGGNFFYISNAQREDMIRMLDEFKGKLQQQKEG